jgi:hypothetical protein
MPRRCHAFSGHFFYCFSFSAPTQPPKQSTEKLNTRAAMLCAAPLPRLWPQETDQQAAAAEGPRQGRRGSHEEKVGSSAGAGAAAAAAAAAAGGAGAGWRHLAAAHLPVPRTARAWRARARPAARPRPVPMPPDCPTAPARRGRVACACWRGPARPAPAPPTFLTPPPPCQVNRLKSRLESLLHSAPPAASHDDHGIEPDTLAALKPAAGGDGAAGVTEVVATAGAGAAAAAAPDAGAEIEALGAGSSSPGGRASLEAAAAAIAGDDGAAAPETPGSASNGPAVTVDAEAAAQQQEEQQEEEQRQLAEEDEAQEGEEQQQEQQSAASLDDGAEPTGAAAAAPAADGEGAPATPFAAALALPEAPALPAALALPSSLPPAGALPSPRAAAGAAPLQLAPARTDSSDESAPPAAAAASSDVGSDSEPGSPMAKTAAEEIEDIRAKGKVRAPPCPAAGPRALHPSGRARRARRGPCTWRPRPRPRPPTRAGPPPRPRQVSELRSMLEELSRSSSAAPNASSPPAPGAAPGAPARPTSATAGAPARPAGLQMMLAPLSVARVPSIAADRGAAATPKVADESAANTIDGRVEAREAAKSVNVSEIRSVLEALSAANSAATSPKKAVGPSKVWRRRWREPTRPTLCTHAARCRALQRSPVRRAHPAGRPPPLSTSRPAPARPLSSPAVIPCRHLHAPHRADRAARRAHRQRDVSGRHGRRRRRARARRRGLAAAVGVCRGRPRGRRRRAVAAGQRARAGRRRERRGAHDGGVSPRPCATARPAARTAFPDCMALATGPGCSGLLSPPPAPRRLSVSHLPCVFYPPPAHPRTFLGQDSARARRRAAPRPRRAALEARAPRGATPATLIPRSRPAAQRAPVALQCA